MQTCKDFAVRNHIDSASSRIVRFICSLSKDSGMKIIWQIAFTSAKHDHMSKIKRNQRKRGKKRSSPLFGAHFSVYSLHMLKCCLYSEALKWILAKKGQLKAHIRRGQLNDASSIDAAHIARAREKSKESLWYSNTKSHTSCTYKLNGYVYLPA